MASASTLVITVRLTWWLRLYLASLLFLCRLLGTEPNWERFSYWVSRGLRVRVIWSRNQKKAK